MSDQKFWKGHWTDRVKQLQAARFTASKISDIISAEADRFISRDAVIGRLNRLGLRVLGQPKARPRSRQSSAESLQSAFNPFVRGKWSGPPLTSDQKEFILGKGIPLLDLARDQCHWPVNDRKGFDDHLFCGAKGYPWCPHHARMAYGSGTPSERRATEAA